MFGAPCLPPCQSNILPLTWTYVIKNKGVKKARCVCNGSPRLKGSVTLGHTHAASLEQSGSRSFLAMHALTNFQVHGTDATNAFAEAPPSTAPSFVRVDTACRNCYTKHKKFGTIPPNHVLPLNQALQGYPESPRLRANYTYKILTAMNFKRYPHEPCLHVGHFYRKTLMFLR